ncbi:MAG: hypothetical protein WCJ93_08280 [Methanomicrobiales archaeon]
MSKTIQEPVDMTDSYEILLTCKRSGEGRYTCQRIFKIPADVSVHPFNKDEVRVSAHEPPKDIDSDMDLENLAILDDDLESKDAPIDYPESGEGDTDQEDRCLEKHCGTIKSHRK